jgi:hypothetical protein
MSLNPWQVLSGQVTQNVPGVYYELAASKHARLDRTLTSRPHVLHSQLHVQLPWGAI